MRCPTLNELPPPPSGKTGWPWTKQSRQLPDTMRNSKPWPRISIVTPSYNQGQFLEETIRSVLLQGYPDLEYIIMDGGSTDNSVEIIRKYEPWLTYWVSEKDDGQADAIYRGFERCTGEIIAYINSDDTYRPRAFGKVAQYCGSNPAIELLIGSAMHVDVKGSPLRKSYGLPQGFTSLLALGAFFAQPACFWTRRAFFAVNGFEQSLRFCFDHDLFLRLMKRQRPGYTRHTLATFRWHEGAKSSTIQDVQQAENQWLQDVHDPDATLIGNPTSTQRWHREAMWFVWRGMLLDPFYAPTWFLKRGWITMLASLYRFLQHRARKAMQRLVRHQPTGFLL